METKSLIVKIQNLPIIASVKTNYGRFFLLKNTEYVSERKSIFLCVHDNELRAGGSYILKKGKKPGVYNFYPTTQTPELRLYFTGAMDKPAYDYILSLFWGSVSRTGRNKAGGHIVVDNPKNKAVFVYSNGRFIFTESNEWKKFEKNDNPKLYNELSKTDKIRELEQAFNSLKTKYIFMKDSEAKEKMKEIIKYVIDNNIKVSWLSDLHTAVKRVKRGSDYLNLFNGK